MRRLLPLPAAEQVDLDALYWVKNPGRQHVRAVMIASAVRVEGYGGDRPSEQQRAQRQKRGLAEAATIAVVTRSCVLDPAGPLFTTPSPARW